MSSDPNVSENGLVGSANDTSQAVPLRSTEAARLQIAKLSLESGLTLEQIAVQSCEIVQQTLKVARVGLWMFVEEDTQLKCVFLLESSGEISEGTILQVADFPDYFEALSTRKIVPAESALGDPKTSSLSESYLLPLGITSMLDAPIYVGGKVVGVVCCEHTSVPREWTTEERDFVASVADMLAKIRASEVHQLRDLLRDNEKRLASMEHWELISKLSLGAAHDFRNLLTVIRANAEIMLMDPDRAPQDVEALQLILQASERGNAMVEDLVDYGRHGNARPAALVISEEIERLLPLLRGSLGEAWQLEVSCQTSKSKVFIARSHFDRILLNLVINARDAMASGGTIRIRVKSLPRNHSNSSSYLVMEVSDEGAGMDESTANRIFEPFFSTKDKGTGLGMAIVKKFVENAGGYLELDTQKGVGTRIRVHLPRVSND